MKLIYSVYSKKLQQITSRSKVEKSIVLSDIHFSAEDKSLVALVFEYMKDMKPDNIFLDGDIIDNYAVSHYVKNPAREQTLKKDVDATIAFLTRLRKEHPQARIVYADGNHEARLQSYIAEKAPALYEYVKIGEILGLKKLNIEHITSEFRENWFKYKDIYVGHYDKVSGNAASTAQSLIREKGVSVIQGHVHKAGITHKTLLDRQLKGIENPCLADPDQADYVKSPSWSQGFTVIYANGNRTWCYVVVADGKSFVSPEGKYYAA